MAKAQFHKNQRVWVETVGTWAVIEKVIPVWAKGFDEPVRITYEIGLGREFQACELEAERRDQDEALFSGAARWRLLRAKNKWQQPEDCGHHPMPGSYPVVVTDENDWGGWRVPGAEYDRDPHRIEQQARLIAHAPDLLLLAARLAELGREDAGDLPPALFSLAQAAADLMAVVRGGERPSEDPAAGPIAA